MQIIVFFKRDQMEESACLCSKPSRNGSMQKIAIIDHTKLKQKANVPLFCLEHISTISYSIFKSFIGKLFYFSSLIQWWNPRVCAQNRLEMRACRTKTMTMKTQEKGRFVINLYREYLLDFLLDYLKGDMKFILLSFLHAQSNGGICMSVLKTV